MIATENLKGKMPMMFPDPEKLKQIFDAIALIMEILPPFEIKPLTLKQTDGSAKKYIAILIERRQQKE